MFTKKKKKKKGNPGDEHVMSENRHSESLFFETTGIGNGYKDTTVHLNRTLCVLTDSI